MIPRRRPRFRAAAALALLAASCAAPRKDGETPPQALSDAEVKRLEDLSRRETRHFPTYVEALTRFSSKRPQDWDDGDRLLGMLEKILDRPVEPELRRAFRSEDPIQREAARKALGRRGEIYRLWMELLPQPDELQAIEKKDDKALADSRRARHIRWIKTRESMVALGEDAALLFVDTFIRMLPNVNADEQMIIRLEIQECGPRAIPLLVALLDVPPRDGTLRMRQQCMIILAGFAHVDTAQAALQRYAKSDDQQTRKLVAESLRMACLGKRAEAPRAILEPMLRNDPSWEVRAAAAKALGDIRCPSALPALLDVLDHCSIEPRENRTSVLKFVVGAIYFIPSDSAIEPLVRVLEDSPHPDLRRNTLLTLNKITGQHYATPAEWRAWLRRRADPSQ